MNAEQALAVFDCMASIVDSAPVGVRRQKEARAFFANLVRSEAAMREAAQEAVDWINDCLQRHGADIDMDDPPTGKLLQAINTQDTQT
jgi:hypothetical protein